LHEVSLSPNLKSYQTRFLIFCLDPDIFNVKDAKMTKMKLFLTSHLFVCLMKTKSKTFFLFVMNRLLVCGFAILTLAKAHLLYFQYFCNNLWFNKACGLKCQDSQSIFTICYNWESSSFKAMWWVQSKKFDPGWPGLGQQSLVQVWVWKIPPKNHKFINFLPLVQKNPISLGQIVPGSKPGWPIIYCGPKVRSGQCLSQF